MIQSVECVAMKDNRVCDKDENSDSFSGDNILSGDWSRRKWKINNQSDITWPGVLEVISDKAGWRGKTSRAW